MRELTEKELNSGKSESRIALVGNPNVGKSVIFGLLTGKYVTVSNYDSRSNQRKVCEF